MDIESQLIERSLDGDSVAFEELVMLFDRKIYNYCYRMTNNPDDAEDLAQEVFIKVYRNLKSFRRDSKFSTWIYRIAHNICIDNHRKKRFRLLSINREDDQQELEMPSTDPLPEDQIISSEGYDMVLECIAALKPEYKSVIILRDIQNYSYEEIADILNKPMGTVKSNISRARACLRDSIRSHRPRTPDGRGVNNGFEAF
ncbi:MAG: sigma-70 family RNA polymerase sigma factor [Clostridiales bacterium]|nr:sigma-70 family RNA polymerase sigma factor [Clostridiales bacterium]